MSKQLQIRNSTAEFLIFQAEDKAEGVQVFYKDESIWATQKAMAMLFDCSTDNIGLHLKNIFESGELLRESVTEKISATATDGKNYLTQFYKLDAIISVGYRVNVRFSHEDVWLNQEQLAEIYCTTQQNVSLHIRNIYTDGELSEEATHKKFLLVRQEGNRNANGWDEWKDADGKTLDEVYRKK